MKAICAKARKLPKQTAELKDDLEAFEAKLDADAAEVAEENAAARAARKQVPAGTPPVVRLTLKPCWWADPV